MPSKLDAGLGDVITVADLSWVPHIMVFGLLAKAYSDKPGPRPPVPLWGFKEQNVMQIGNDQWIVRTEREGVVLQRNVNHFGENKSRETYYVLYELLENMSGLTYTGV